MYIFCDSFSFNTIEFFSTALLCEENTRAELQSVFDFLGKKKQNGIELRLFSPGPPSGLAETPLPPPPDLPNEYGALRGHRAGSVFLIVPSFVAQWAMQVQV